MASILKHGKYRVVTCSECGCEFSFHPYELDENNQIECPECGKMNTAQVKVDTKKK